MVGKVLRRVSQLATYLRSYLRTYPPNHTYVPLHTKDQENDALLELVCSNALQAGRSGGETEQGKEQEEEATPAKAGEPAAGAAPALASAPQVVASAWASP